MEPKPWQPHMVKRETIDQIVAWLYMTTNHRTAIPYQTAATGITSQGWSFGTEHQAADFGDHLVGLNFTAYDHVHAGSETAIDAPARYVWDSSKIDGPLDPLATVAAVDAYLDAAWNAATERSPTLIALGEFRNWIALGYVHEQAGYKQARAAA